MIEFLTSAIDFNKISALPWIVLGPGLFLIFLFLSGALTKFLTLRWIRALTNIVYAFIVALVLSRYGQSIAQMIQGPPPQ